MSASATVVASNILCGPPGTLKRVSGTPAVIPPSAIDLRADPPIAGDIFLSAFMNLPGASTDRDHPRDWGWPHTGALPNSPTGRGAGQAGAAWVRQRSGWAKGVR